jgi:hypothetical protein
MDSDRAIIITMYLDAAIVVILIIMLIKELGNG